MKQRIMASANVHAPVLVALALLAGCGGGNGGSEQTSSATSFRAYVASAASDSTAPTALTAIEVAETAQRSREWAVATLVTRDTSIFSGGLVSPVTANAVAFPPLYFGRTQAVAAAAAGETLAQIRLSLPAATPGVQAALMRGIRRTISAGPDAAVTTDFMRSVTSAGQVAPWAALTLNPLSAATLANEPRLRLRIVDEFHASLPWPQVVAFDGVFANAGAVRVRVPMLRVTGQLRSTASADMTAVALAMPQGRWLVRITPIGPIMQWSATELQAALARATAEALSTSGATSDGELVLPAVSGFAALGLDDIRGLALAQDRVRADLRGLDGKGGTYGELPPGWGALALGAAGLTLYGGTTTSFVFSPDNSWSGGTEIKRFDPPPPPVACGDTNLQPAYLALVNEQGGVEMLARFTSLEGLMCE